MLGLRGSQPGSDSARSCHILWGEPINAKVDFTVTMQYISRAFVYSFTEL